MRVLLESYGCTMNRGEAMELRALLLADGQTIVMPETGEFDRAIIYTCGVIGATEIKMLKRIKELAEAGKDLVVCGCLGAIAESEILKIAPQARIFTPPERDRAHSHLCHSPPGEGAGAMPQIDDAIGIVPIASGCLGECTYCITRFARGPLVSRSPETVIEKAGRLIRAGAREIQITAQDTGVYGSDIGSSLPDLLMALANIPEGHSDAGVEMCPEPSPDRHLFRATSGACHMFRVGMMTPNSALLDLERLVEAFKNPRIFKFLHLPLQSGSDRMLVEMGRRYTRADFLKVVNTFREAIPDMTISTDVIIGFPGEKEEDFGATMKVIKRIQPDIVNVTRFSPRPGTPAANFPHQLHGRVSKERSRALADLRFEISSRTNSLLHDRQVDALATEFRKEGSTFFRTVNYKPVIVDGTLPLGRWARLKITGSGPTHLFGRVVRPTKSK